MNDIIAPMVPEKKATKLPIAAKGIVRASYVSK